ncbi:hypothetical protein ACFW04_012011 [Cataglyphis niger]
MRRSAVVPKYRKGNRLAIGLLFQACRADVHSFFTLRTKCKLIGLMKTCSKFRNDQETEILTLLSGLHPRRNFTR